MPKTIDICVRPRSKNDLEEMVKIAPRMGYSGLVVETANMGMEDIALASKKSNTVNLYTRITLRPKSKSEMLKLLRRTSKAYDIVAVESKNPEVIRHAARDGRVDIVVLKPSNARYMDRSQALLLREGGGLIEIRLSDIIGKRMLSWRKLRGFLIIVRRAVAYDAPIAVSSNASTKWGMWHAKSIEALLISMGLSEQHAKTIVYIYPKMLLRRK